MIEERGIPQHGVASRPSGSLCAAGLLVLLLLTGCGTTKQQRATEQLVLSDAVDHAIADIDFSPLRNRRVFLDTTNLRTVKGFDFVNAPYIIGSLREGLVRAGCRLEDDRNSAEVIVEARVGALGMDAHDVTYGIPPSRILSTAASLVPNAPPIPVIPEISLGKRSDMLGVAKVNVFAYEAKTRQPLWQSGTALAKTTTRDTWVLGAGPFQSGTIHEGPLFLGREIRFPKLQDLQLIAEPPSIPGLPRFARRIDDGDSAKIPGAENGEPGDSAGGSGDKGGKSSEAAAAEPVPEKPSPRPLPPAENSEAPAKEASKTTPPPKPAKP